ncbi:MAG: alpha-2-macroglobulin family protein, partial [Planctomycetaceae bacterium]
FEARPIDVARLLQQVKQYLKGKPKDLDWQRLNVQDLGYRVVMQEGAELLGAPVANWSLDLAPAEGHLDQTVTVATPLQKAGAYLVTGRLADGNVSRIVVWLADLALVKKPLANRQWYYVADARTGAPIEDEKVTVEFFGWQAVQAVPDRPGFQVVTQNKAFYTTAQGDLSLGEKELPSQLQWLAIATTPKGRLAYLGFTGLWFAPSPDQTFDQVRAFALTDRPVYRPGQKVHFKFWVQRARYDQPEVAEFANRQFEVVLRDSQGNETLKQQLKADEFGGVAGEHELPAGAPLGPWHLQILAEAGQPVGDGFFRVEEYKKPEFEVTIDAPTRPVRLGEAIEAKIRGRYLVGGGVAGARVHYRVIRTASDHAFYPPGPWDWLYGPGYGCLASDSTWFPGSREWSGSRPAPPWWPRPVPPPEVVLDGEALLDAEGNLVVPIDTRAAQEQHGNSDHRYQITAEVTDASRRTIVGEGSVLAARHPFAVQVWLDRGFYDTGDTINATVMAQTPAGVPVAGRGELTLLRVTHVANEPAPREEAVRSWEVETTASGTAEQRIAASEPGQYRLRLRLTDAAGTTREGAVLFVIRGEKFDSREFRFNDLELLTDQREYSVGQKVRLMINTNRANAAVLLFVRAANGLCPPPRLIRVQGKSTVEEIEVVPGDLPNFFVEALTISQGQVHSVVREVFVPPEKRVLNVEVTAEATELLPGGRANLLVKLTDLAGRPFVGSTVLSVYDRALDLIAGEQAIPDIRTFFWSYRRSHQPQFESNLTGRFANLLKPGEEGMRLLGLNGGELLAMNGMMPMMAGATGGGIGGGMPGVEAAPMMADNAAMARGMGAPAMVATAAGPPEGPAALAAPVVRKQFADLAYWTAALTTDEDGTARVEFPMPENLTGWKVRVWGLGRGTRVGEGSTELITRKQLMVRLQAPRFFVEKDEVVLSAIVRNELPEAKQVRVSLETTGETLDQVADPVRQVSIPAGGEQRVDWRVAVLREGQATVRMLAQSDVEADGMEQTFPVLVHGAPQLQAASGVVRPQAQSAQVKLRVPAERRVNDSRLEVRVSPTLAGAMVDALPFLAAYPHGCTEQTLNRFLPTVVTRNILRDMGLDLEQIGRKRANLNPQELGDPQVRAKDWERSLRNPVYDPAEVARMVEAGVQALTDMQLTDGGWGWFSGFGEQSTPHTTAVVVHGLQQAARYDVALVPGMLDRGVDWLNRHQ